MHAVPNAVMDYVGPALGALLFVAVMSLVAEPTRRTLNAMCAMALPGSTITPSPGEAARSSRSAFRSMPGGVQMSTPSSALARASS